MLNTPGRWFVRGFLVGILISGSLTAVSYFFRSERGGNLLGNTPNPYEALGFPCTPWETGNMVGGLFIDLRALLVNGRGNALLYACHHPVADSDFSTNAKRHPISGPVVPSRTRLALSRQDFLRWPARSLHLPQFSVLTPS